MGAWVEIGSCTQEVRAPAEFAYAILSDYPRWPEWSPWLSKVVLTGGAAADGVAGGAGSESRWYLSIKGVDVSWTSRTLEAVEGRRVRWER